MTVIGPDTAPAGTVARTSTSETAVNPPTTPPNRTSVTPVRFVPAIVTIVPAAPVVGRMALISGARGSRTVNTAGLSAMPLAVTTVMRPLVAPAGTVARTDKPSTL